MDYLKIGIAKAAKDTMYNEFKVLTKTDERLQYRLQLYKSTKIVSDVLDLSIFTNDKILIVRVCIVVQCKRLDMI
jgi:hypothetical protein